MSLCPDFSLCQLETVTEYRPYRVPGKTKWIKTGKALRTVPVTVSTTITERVREEVEGGTHLELFSKLRSTFHMQYLHVGAHAFHHPFLPFPSFTHA